MPLIPIAEGLKEYLQPENNSFGAIAKHASDRELVTEILVRRERERVNKLLASPRVPSPRSSRASPTPSQRTSPTPGTSSKQPQPEKVQQDEEFKAELDSHAELAA